MADQQSAKEVFFTHMPKYYGVRGAAAEDKLVALLEQNPGIASFVAESGANSVDIALRKNSFDMARELAAAAQMQASPADKREFQAKLEKALNKDQTANEQSDIRKKLLAEYVKSLPAEANLTPQMASFKDAVKLREWSNKNPIYKEYGDSYMHIAAAQGRTDIMDLLKKENEKQVRVGYADQNAPDAEQLKKDIAKARETHLTDGNGFRETPLIAAAKHGQVKAIEWLSKEKVAQYGQTINGGNAAHYAAAHNQKAALEALKKTGMKIDVKNGIDNKPFEVAVAAGNKDIVTYLFEDIKTNAERPALARARLDGALNSATTPDMIEHLISLGADVKNLGGQFYLPPLMTLGSHKPYQHQGYGIPDVKIDNIGVLNTLLKNGADPDISELQDSPLLRVLRLNLGKDIAAKLIEHMENLDTVDITGRTAMHITAEKNDTETLKLLIKKAPKSIEMRDMQGRRPLEEAIINRELEAMRQLSKVTDLDAQDKNNNSALHTAVDAFTLLPPDTSDEVFKARLEVIKMVRTDNNVKMAGGFPNVVPKTPEQILQEDITRIKNEIQNGAVNPGHIRKLEYLNRAVEALEKPAEKTSMKVPPLSDKKLAEAVSSAKGAEVTLANPSEKAKTIPTLPPKPTLAV